ncbi:hypothetical protein SARC_03285 [Sphaeroforma arctica JP610]|uniref:Ribosome biogenesis protein WDR12 homolog n=1 Tax=Sphaeroforma arctica JP610 TaxID=667725 RepID=A0A0L0G6K2_9EUKA|nr:hypothetical protein SARC_03285 [Sphaeroforma arctica JP610]KNC84511.1 hypothetical protein SARC_03285 [Sphaeroforma arctica JP610]|eukprot:XP_014158413.1 hypothetical protein SARC_03285 [Sphaeroforma arctica JP610]
MVNMSSTTTTEVGPTSTVQVRFVPSDEAQFTVTDTPIAVPETLRRYALSEIVNHLLGNEKPIPFDFLVDGMLLRTSVAKYLESHALSRETIVKLEFFMATPAPEASTELPHDDWVGALDTNSNGLILTGSYDGVVSLWSGTGDRVATAAEHTGGIKRLETISDDMFVTASLDHSLRVWGGVREESLTTKLLLSGHTGSVEGVAVSSNGQTCVSGSFDKTLRVWSLAPAGSLEGEEEQSGKKKRKTNVSAQRTTTTTREASLVLEGHTNGVTSVVYGPQNTVYSASWDHSIRQWDINSGRVVHTLVGGKVIQSIAYSESANLIVSAGADKAVRLWDPRESATTMIKRTLVSHTGMTSSVAWSPTDGNQFVSAAYDGDIKIWDARSSIPLHTVKAIEGKVLCVAWPSKEQILCGGDDNRVHIHSVGK